MTIVNMIIQCPSANNAELGCIVNVMEKTLTITADQTVRVPLLQMIYDMINSNASDETLALKFNLTLAETQRYRAAVKVFYDGTRRI